MKTEALLTKIADRDARPIWEKKGSMDTEAHAKQRVNEILAQHTESLLSAEQEARLRAEFRDLIPVILEMPQPQ
jgi:trimethylamine:corrinoid methyltransferase-like protein